MPLPDTPSRSPRGFREWGIAALVYLLAVLSLGYPALGGGFLLTPHSDQYIGGFAIREYAAASLKAGHGIPTWNPYLFGGMPFVGSMNGDMFYPTALLRVLLPTDVGMTWGFIVHVFLAGLFAYAFLRAWGFGFLPSLAAGLAYEMSGYMASLVSPGHDGKLFVTSLFPMALLLILRGVRDGRHWAWGALAIVIGLQVLSPHPQLLQYSLLASGSFALFVAYGKEWNIPRQVATRRIAMALGAVILGGIIGAVQYVPVRAYVAWSPRAGGLRGYDVATSYSMPLEELVNTYLPQFTGILDHYWGRNGIHFHSEYLGAAILVLAFAAYGAGQLRKRFVMFWTGVLIIGLLWSLGGFTPFYHLVYALVPGSKFFRAPSTIFFLPTFALAMLVAVAFERLELEGISRRYALSWGIGALVVALLATTGGLTNLAQTVALDGRADLVDANAGAVIAGAWRSFAMVFIAVLILMGAHLGKITRRVAAIALIALFAVDQWSILRLYWNFSAPASTLYASDPAIDYLKKQAEPGRVLAVPISEPEAPHDPVLEGDALMIHRVRSAMGYHGNEIGRYDVLLDKQGGYRNIGNPNFWALANVRWFLTNVPNLPITGAQRVVGPVKDAAGSTVYLYQMPGDNAAAWVVPLIVKASDDQVAATVLDPRFNVRTAALFDTGAAVHAVAPQSVRALPGPLAIRPRITRYDPGHVTVQLDSAPPAGSALVVSENYYPGWTATVDGKPATIGRADLSLIGIELPVGAHVVDLTFHDASYVRGKMLTIAAVLLALLLWIGGAVYDRRTMREASPR